MRRFALLILLILSGSAFADTVEVVDYYIGQRIAFTACTITPSKVFEGDCGAKTIYWMNDEVPPPPGIWPEVDVEMVHGTTTHVWDGCYITQAFGLPGGGVAYRIECPGPFARKPGLTGKS